MNSLNFLNNMLRMAIKPCLTVPPTISLQQTRNTYVLKRRHKPPLAKKDSVVQRMRRRYFIYDLVENTDLKKKEPIKVILTQVVDGVGSQGDVISMTPFRAYNQFLLPGIAVYATPENLQKFNKNEISEVDKNSHYESRTADYLGHFLLKVFMNAHNPWTLKKRHIRLSFRGAGIHLDDNCITMPLRPISGPNFDIENKEFYVTITINKRRQVIVRCRIRHWSDTADSSIPVFIDADINPSEPIYPEDKEVLDSLPIPYLRQKAIDNNQIKQS